MSAIHDRIIASFKDSQAEPRVIDVPEWNLTIYVWPETIEQRRAWDAGEDVYQTALNVIKVRAKDADGKRLFDDRDIESLKTRGVGKWGPAVIARVAGDIMADQPDDEEIEKN